MMFAYCHRVIDWSIPV